MAGLGGWLSGNWRLELIMQAVSRSRDKDGHDN